MKKLLTLILITLSLCSSVNSAFATEKKSFKFIKPKAEKGYVSSLYSVTKFFCEYEYAANNYNHNTFLNLYTEDYLSADGFNYNVMSRLVKDTWKTYPGIKYRVKVNSVNFYKNLAIADVTETAKGYAKVENENVGEFVSSMQSIYYLKPNGNSWVITGDYTIKENIILSWGDAKQAKISLEVPNQLQAGQEYTATLSVAQPSGVISIGSITADKITYPQNPSKEIYRKFSSDGKLERIMKTNTENTNEYVVATVGFTRPKVDDNQNLDINLTGYACLMERINVIPVNKFIEEKDVQTK